MSSSVVSSFEGEQRKPKGAVLFTGEVGGARLFELSLYKSQHTVNMMLQ